MTTHVTTKGWAPKVGILLALAGATTLTIAIDVWLSSANRHVLPRKGGLLDLLLIVVVVLLTLALHEAIHGVAFLGFGGRPRYRIGLATWYPYFPGRCASSYLPHGTRITVRDLQNGHVVHCEVTDRQGSRDGRVVDLSQTDFSHLTAPWRGVVRVKVSW